MIVDKYGRVGGSINLAELAELYAQTDDDDLKDHYLEVAVENGLDLEGSPESDVASLAAVDAEGAVEAVEHLGEPPRGGPGSGRDEWANYAATLGVEVTDDMSRDDIIAACDEE